MEIVKKSLNVSQEEKGCFTVEFHSCGFFPARFLFIHHHQRILIVVRVNHIRVHIGVPLYRPKDTQTSQITVT